MNKWYIVVMYKGDNEEHYVGKKYKGKYVKTKYTECRLETTKSHATRIGRDLLDVELTQEYTIKLVERG